MLQLERTGISMFFLVVCFNLGDFQLCGMEPSEIWNTYFTSLGLTSVLFVFQDCQALDNFMSVAAHF